MSRIRQLTISGIRNFGDDNEEAVIRFSRPLTLILGPNGTGKTTIIEALKFATTGEFPPGSDRGKSFIHDPLLSTTSSIRGIVKAQIADKSGNTFIIRRTVESSKANVAVKFKTLDNALSRVNKGSKEIISLTNRCANVDSELAVALGVSKPILNYVIFCHQEDLSWPFQDGKKLKEKFDEIFDSAKYNKALEHIMKYCKDVNDDIRVLKAQKESLHVIITEVTDKEEKLEDHKKRLEDSKEKVEEIVNELEPINQKIRQLEKTESEYKDILAEEEKKRAEYDLSKQQVDRLKETIQEVFDGTLEELNAYVNSYDDDLLKKSDDIKEFAIKLKDISKEESTVTNMLAEERVTVGTLRQQVKDHEMKVVYRNRVLQEALTSSNLDSIDSDISEIEVAALTKRLEEKMREWEHKVEESRGRMEQQEKELQKEVDRLRTEHSKIESEKNVKENEVVEARQEIDRIRSEISQLGAAASKLNSVEARIEEAKKKFDELSKEMDVDNKKKEIQDKIKSRDSIESMLNAVDEEISSLHKQSSLQAEFELHKSTLRSKEKEMQKFKDKYEQKIKTLLDVKELGETKLKHQLDNVQQELVNETKTITQEIQAEQRRLTTLETTISHNEHELQKIKKELDADKTKISSICDYKDFDEVLLLQSRKVKDLQDRRGMYAHQAVAYKEYMKRLKEKNPCCPLCHRGFSERESVETLLTEMENEVENHPSRLKDCEAELKVQQGKYDTMLQLKPKVEKVIQVEDTELEKLNNNLEKTKIKATQLRASLAELETRKVNPENKLATYKEIIGDIMLWDRCIDEISGVKRTINNAQKRLAIAGVKTERTLEETQAQKEELKASLKKIRDEVENLQSKLNVHNDKLQNARAAHNSLQEEQLKIRSDMQKLKQLRDKQEALYVREISLGKSVDSLRQKSNIAENELKTGTHRLEKQKKENRERQDSDRKIVTEGTKRLSELHKVQDEVDTFIGREVPSALERSESKIQDYTKSIERLVSEKTDIEGAVAKVKDEITRQEVRKAELTNNIVLRKTEETTKRLEAQCESLKEKLQAFNHNEILEEWQVLQSREEALQRQKNMAKGNQEELRRAVLQYTEDLRKEQYRQARDKYKNKCIELTVQEEVILNLKAYTKVLDAAMIEYHEERMATINKIMKQMWKLVYTGNDTTSIEIRTDATQGVGNGRRTYNYKLIQTKHGHEMDMKGRCSAGQRVLASIIIRLALAETFCKDCGILALDEPTTNLDEENANSLATALANVVKLRSQRQKNFQLIVISHDEKFLLKLAHLNNNKGFYELYRKHNGYTAVKRCHVNTPENIEADVIKEELSSDDDQSEYSSKSGSKQQSEKGLEESPQSEKSSRNKRQTWDNDDEDPNEDRPNKRRYVFND